MVSESIVRFVIGGLAVSLFSITGDLFRPKTFAGLFGAAPSVALASLGLAIAKHGGAYAAIEGRSMVIGACALCAYSLVVSRLLIRNRLHALVATTASLVVWLGLALGGWYWLLR